MSEKTYEINLTGSSALASVVLTIVFLLAIAAYVVDAAKPKKALVILEIEKTKLEIEKLNLELAIYREQESVIARAE